MALPMPPDVFDRALLKILGVVVVSLAFPFVAAPVLWSARTRLRMREPNERAFPRSPRALLALWVLFTTLLAALATRC